MTPQEQQQVDAAMEQLSAYIAQPPWEEWMVEVFTAAIDYAAEMLDITVEDILDYLDEPPLGQMAHAHVFEHFVTTETNEDGQSVLQAFIQQYAQRQASHSHGIAYLNALANAPLVLWEVMGVKPGHSISVRRFGTQDTPVSVLLEAEQVPRDMCIAARLITLANGEHTFGFGLLPIEKQEAEDILAYLAQVRDEMLEKTSDAVQPELADLDTVIAEEMTDLMFNETLASWLSQGFEE